MQNGTKRPIAWPFIEDALVSPYNIDVNSYTRILRCEEQLAKKSWEFQIDVMNAWQNCCFLEEVIKNSLIPRALSKRIYGGNGPTMVYESVAAHTNLMRELVDLYFAYIYGPNFEDYYRPGGYTYREYQKAIARHDLPENETGDTCDNNGRNEEKKLAHERGYQERLSSITTPANSTTFDANVLRLLNEMATQSSEAGRILYVADKVSAILTCLYLDKIAPTIGIKPPRMKMFSRYSSVNDRKEMRICERIDGNLRRASEMWTIDYLKLRRRVRFDDSGFFTSILVMYTLMVNKTWYNWRERDYRENNL